MEVDVTGCISKDELIEKINDLEIKDNQLIKIILTGKRNFEIDKYELYKLLTNERIIKIKDNTKIQYNLEKMANMHTLKGLFVKEILKEKENAGEEELTIIEKAVEIAFEALE